MRADSFTVSQEKSDVDSASMRIPTSVRSLVPEVCGQSSLACATPNLAAARRWEYCSVLR